MGDGSSSTISRLASRRDMEEAKRKKRAKRGPGRDGQEKDQEKALLRYLGSPDTPPEPPPHCSLLRRIHQLQGCYVAWLPCGAKLSSSRIRRAAGRAKSEHLGQIAREVTAVSMTSQRACATQFRLKP